MIDMTSQTVDSQSLIDRYRSIYAERMDGLDFVNRRLRVEGVGFRDFQGGQLGVLITPWFVNLVLLKPQADWAEYPQGHKLVIEFPQGPIEFILNRDEILGSFLSAVLFGTTTDFPDQETARDIAAEVMSELFVEREQQHPRMSRRDFFSGLGQ
jgi:[NiFe] hydrogenase assembly HybE family chaperone